MTQPGQRDRGPTRLTGGYWSRGSGGVGSAIALGSRARWCVRAFGSSICDRAVKATVGDGGRSMDERKDETPRSLSKSDDRDRDADALDAAADQHDMSANLASWLTDDDASGEAHRGRKSARQGRTKARAERRSAAGQRSAQPAHEVDVEVRIGDTWCPGYLYAHHWRKNLAGHWQCFVSYVAVDPTDPTGRAVTRAGYFDDNDIRQVSTER